MRKKKETQPKLVTEEISPGNSVTYSEAPGKITTREPVKVVTVQTIHPRKIYLCGQALEFLKDETRILRSDKIKYLDEILKKLAAADPPVIKIIEVKEE